MPRGREYLIRGLFEPYLHIPVSTGLPSYILRFSEPTRTKLDPNSFFTTVLRLGRAGVGGAASAFSLGRLPQWDVHREASWV